MTTNLLPVLTPSTGYKPFRYPWAYDYWNLQQSVHWIPSEVPLGEDVKDWERKITPQEKNLLTQIFRFFTQSDIEVSDNYQSRLMHIFKPTEITMMLTAFANMETVHIASYALLLETVGMPDVEFQAFHKYAEMVEKHDFLQGFTTDDPIETLITLAAFGAFIEGLSLFASFAMLLNFPRRGKMKGMGQIITWSVRDESLHCEGIIKLYHTMKQEYLAANPERAKSITDLLERELTAICEHVVSLEDNFIDLAFAMGPVEGMTAVDIKAYIRFIADWRLNQLGLKPVYHIEKHPLPWMMEILNGQEHSNFFEARATEYTKGATLGDWNSVWDKLFI